MAGKAPAAGMGSGNETRYSPTSYSDATNDGFFETSWSSPFIVERQGWASTLAGALPWLVFGVLAWKFAKR